MHQHTIESIISIGNAMATGTEVGHIRIPGIRILEIRIRGVGMGMYRDITR
jgi:hypothetical protein